MVSDVRLKNTERADIFRFVTNAGFTPTEFDWTDEKGFESFRSSMGGGAEYLASRLTHTPTCYYLRFGGSHCEFSPGEENRVEWVPFDGWKSRVQTCNRWLSELQREVNTVDLWALAKQETALTQVAGSDIENGPFTATEREDISKKVDAVKNHLLSFRQFDEREAAMIEGRLKYLEESSQRFGKKDWLNLAYSTLFGLAVTLALEPQKAHSLLQLAGALFSSFLDGVKTLLG